MSTTLEPYGLRFSEPRAPHVADDLVLSFDPAAQLNLLADGTPLAADPDLMAAVTVSWETADQ